MKIKGFAALLPAVLLCLALAACGSAEDEDSLGDLSAFTADTVSGGQFTQDGLSEYDLTVVNIWALTCPYCIEEMPAIELVYEQLPENMNLISICSDAQTDMIFTKHVLNGSGAQFETLIGNQELQESILKNVTGTPTTLFVDSKGKQVGKAIFGMPDFDDMQKIADVYLAAADAALQSMGK